MGRFMIVSRMKKLQEYIKIAKEYDVSFEINDFYEPEILDDDTTGSGDAYELPPFLRDRDNY